MRLSSLKYVEFPGEDAEWSLDGLILSQVNLLVGKNATGKTRTLNVINSLSQLLAGERHDISNSSYEASFEDDSVEWSYSLEFDKFAVTREILLRNDEDVLHRGQGGTGSILAEDIDKKPKIRFRYPGNNLAVVAKRDEVQHPFLQPILDWAASIRYFSFGGGMNPTALAFAVKGVSIAVDERATGQLVPIFNKGLKEFKEEYVRGIISDMKPLGYDLSEIESRRPQNVAIKGVLPGEVIGLSVKERGLRGWTDQPSISAGMFSALSLLAQANYYALAKRGGCILVDDIGENLDFERSCAIIDLLRKKAYDSSFQLIMSTNNRFVMNRVPLEEWCLLQPRA